MAGSVAREQRALGVVPLTVTPNHSLEDFFVFDPCNQRFVDLKLLMSTAVILLPGNMVMVPTN